MGKKSNDKKTNGTKIRKLEERKRYKEKLTNWYMINLCWGLVALIALSVLYYCYHYPNIIVKMPIVCWIMVGTFAAAAILLFVLGKTEVIKNKSRAFNYSIFTGVCAVGSLWLALYNKLRPMFETLAMKITGEAVSTVGSYWNVWTLMILVGVYLVAAFIWYVVKLAKA